MPRTLSDEQLRRVAEKFRKTLGRELTPQERKYLGLSIEAVRMDGLELHPERRKNKGQDRPSESHGQKEAKRATGLGKPKLDFQRTPS
jgi:hypothetical protein